MINISKQFAVWVTALKRDKFRVATFTLTFFYVLSTAVILFVSSAAVLIIFAPPEDEFSDQAEVQEGEIDYDDLSLYEAREHLPAVIALVDVSMLLLVSIFSYYFARRTLLPIKNMHEEQQRFMGDVAHELRTPLSVMQAGADTMLKKQRTASEYTEFITDVQEETSRLTRLSNQLLQLLSARTIKINATENIDISDLCETELRRFRPFAQERGVMIEGNISPAIMLHTQSDSFIQIVQNLLKNAIEYNKRDGHVSLSLFESETQVTVEISDTGIGVPFEKQTAIFERFVKGDSARTQTMNSGAGLGLAIVHALVTKLEGQLTLNSTPNIGTKITVTVPKTHS